MGKCLYEVKLTIYYYRKNKLSEQALKELSKTLVRLFDESEEKKRSEGIIPA